MKSARQHIGFAALNADMSDTKTALCTFKRTARPSAVSPSACIDCSRSRCVSLVYMGGGWQRGTFIFECGAVKRVNPFGCCFSIPSGSQ